MSYVVKKMQRNTCTNGLHAKLGWKSISSMTYTINMAYNIAKCNNDWQLTTDVSKDCDCLCEVKEE